jgi:hypothetical protein
METSVKLFSRCWIYFPLVTLQTSRGYSNSSHVRRKCDSQLVAVACEIRSRSSQRDCGIGGRYTWSSTLPHRQQDTWRTVRGSRTPRNGFCLSCHKQYLTYAFQTLLERRSRLITYNQRCQRKLNGFLCRFQVSSCFDCNRFKNTVACTPVSRRRPRDRRLYSSRS